MAQVFRMATDGGAKTTGYAGTTGTLAPGKAADLVLIDWNKLAYPYLDEETPLLDAVIQRAKGEAVKLNMCDGEVIYRDGRFIRSVPTRLYVWLGVGTRRRAPLCPPYKMRYA
jgi:cytosine/adenosine deaminase-related metal-dependent hydrolase